MHLLEEGRAEMNEKKRKRILVSACLLGMNCRYDGNHNYMPELGRLSERAELVPFCPEIYGGLSTPRQPSERHGGQVVTKDGRDVTEQFERGAHEAWKAAQWLGCGAAILKERSPSCGSHQVYDGTFTGTRIEGMGVTAALLQERGILLFSEEELADCIRWVTEEDIDV